MSATVFAGVAQIIVVDAWPKELTAATIFASAVVTALICSHFILIGASMRPSFGGMRERGLVYFTSICWSSRRGCSARDITTTGAAIRPSCSAAAPCAGCPG